MFSVLLVALGVSLSLVESPATAQTRTDVVINGNWKFTRHNAVGAEKPDYRDTEWESVSLPHTWNGRDGQDGGNDYYRGTGWYRRSLAIDSKFRGKNFYLKFDGAASVTEAFVNGKIAGKHKGSFGASCFDITSLIKIGQNNSIAVKVNNAKDSTIAPLRGDFTIYGGIYRGVHLLALDKLSISPLDDASPGVYAKQVRVNEESADLEITTKLLNGHDAQKAPTVRWTILDHKGKTVQRSEARISLAPKSREDVIQNVSITKPHLWNGRQDPYLYKLVTEVLDGKSVVDRVVEPIGLRSFNIDPEKGFSLNGKAYRLYGVNRHQDRESMGWAITAKEHVQDFRMIEEIGANAIRLAHYQHAQEFYDLCDRGGMVVWAELALVDEINPCQEFAAVCQQQLRELIKQNYNHPSIFFWSLQNELIPDSDPEMYAQFVRDLNSLAKRLDPTRPTAVASRSKYDGKDGINATTDVIAYNVYRGWYDGKPEDFGKFADKLHQNFPQHKMAISEYGAGASIRQHEDPPKKPPTRGPWHPEEWQSYLHEVTWRAMVERPYLWGTFVWNMFDFGSDGRSEGDRFGLNDKGLVSFDRTVRKDAFYWYKANWNPEPMIHITGRRYSPRPAGSVDLKVYSNCDYVELILNGVSAGTKTSIDKIFIWTACQLKTGKNEILAIAAKDGKCIMGKVQIVGETKKVSSGAAR